MCELRQVPSLSEPPFSFCKSQYYSSNPVPPSSENAGYLLSQASLQLDHELVLANGI